MIAQENIIKKLHNKTCATTLVKERNVVCYHFCNMNALHSYRRDYSHQRNEWDGAKSENERHEAQANLTKITEDPNQCSEEPKANICLGRQVPVHPMPIIFNYMQFML